MSEAAPRADSPHLSTISQGSTRTWAPPRSPLPPHRLAKLANALGVSLPMPAYHSAVSLPIHSPASALSTSSTPSLLSDVPRRSQTPSIMSSHSHTPYTPSTSRYLLHVIPPLYLPHDSDTSDSDLTPPPSTASGYHTQFRRGTLVPFHSTLQSQLGAIAKEYALPSTTGLILYLVASGPRSMSPGASADDFPTGEPGPRLSEEIWKHLWTRVLRVDHEESIISPSRSPTPSNFGLGLGPGLHGVAYSQDNQGPLRQLVSPRRVETPQPFNYPFTPSPSTPSSSSDLRSNSKSSVSRSEPETPDTSSSSHFGETDVSLEAQTLDLPGLRSPSIIPILAKIEFDIDRRKAGWFEPWLRSRRMNFAKRAESVASNRNGTPSHESRESKREEDEEERRAPMDLKLLDRLKPVDPFAKEAEAGYAPLTDDGDSDATGEDEEEPTARMTITGNKDPLEDVFGTDADTWADLHADLEPPQIAKRQTSPNVTDLALNGTDLALNGADLALNGTDLALNGTDLALNGTDLAALPDQRQFDDDDDDDDLLKDEEEVKDILRRMNRPSLTVSIPSSPVSTNGRRKSSPSTATARKHVPPPLVLAALPHDSDILIPGELNSGIPLSSGSSVGLPYLKKDDVATFSPDAMQSEFEKTRSPAEEKREGGVFDDLDLGLGEYDENDPNDHRRSQFMFRARLDEIEKIRGGQTLAQFSPSNLEVSNEDDDTLQPPSAGKKFSDDMPPPSPGFPPRNGERGSLLQETEKPSWPAVPYSALSAMEKATSPSDQNSDLPALPQLAVNGVSTAAPKAFMQSARSSVPSSASSESELRKRELAEQDASYSALIPSSTTLPPTQSPIIPLSPDPFGRHSSQIQTGDRQSSVYWEKPLPTVSSSASAAAAESRPASGGSSQPSRHSSTPSSRFSTDSTTGVVTVPEDKNAKASSSLMSVSSIKKLWRKSNKNSISGSLQPPNQGRISPQLTPPLPSVRPNVAAAQDAQAPSPIPRSPRLPVAMPPPQRPPTPKSSHEVKQSRMGGTLDHFHFDQESPYPSRRSAARHSPQPASLQPPAVQPTQHLSPPQSIPPTQLNHPLPPDPPAPEKEKERNSIRKSILKSWKSASGNLAQGSNSTSDGPRSSGERSSNESTRQRRPSVLELKHTRGSLLSNGSDIPPSPRIPEQYMGLAGKGNGPLSNQQQLSHTRPSMSSSSTAEMSIHSSPPSRSLRSIASSDDARPSFDSSQFEMVSPPKLTSTLSYPYHGLDHRDD